MDKKNDNKKWNFQQMRHFPKYIHIEGKHNPDSNNSFSYGMVFAVFFMFAVVVNVYLFGPAIVGKSVASTLNYNISEVMRPTKSHFSSSDFDEIYSGKANELLVYENQFQDTTEVSALFELRLTANGL